MRFSILRVSATLTAIAIIATGVEFSLKFIFNPPTNAFTIEGHKKEDAARRPRSEDEEREREEEEEEDESGTPSNGHLTGGLLPVRQASPFTPIVDELPSVPTVALPTNDLTLARDFDARRFDIHAVPTDIAPPALAHCKALIEQTLDALPAPLTKSLDTMTLYFSAHEPRGLSNSHLVELQCGGLSDREVVAVLVHELGHVTDLGAFRGVGSETSAFRDGTTVIPTDDTSTQFYGVSWRDSDTRKMASKRNDFVSGYAMTDPFEDFAESFIAYILHGDDFRTLATKSTSLQKKYDFLRASVFDGKEYTSSTHSLASGRHVWDVTLVSYDVGGFLSSNGASLASLKKVR